MQVVVPGQDVITMTSPGRGHKAPPTSSTVISSIALTNQLVMATRTVGKVVEVPLLILNNAIVFFMSLFLRLSCFIPLHKVPAVVTGQAWSIRTNQYLGVIGQGRVVCSSDRFVAILNYENLNTPNNRQIVLPTLHVYDLEKCTDL